MEPSTSKPVYPPHYRVTKALDAIVLGLLVIFFIDFLAFDYDLIGLEKPAIAMPHEVRPYFESIIWVIFAVLALDLCIKYRQLNNWKLLLKTYWIDIVMLALIPVFVPLKFMKVSIKLIKTFKATKSGVKAGQKAKKVHKSFFYKGPG